MPRKYAFNPKIDALEQFWGNASTREIHEATTKSIVRALAASGDSLRFKALFVRLGVGFIVFGLVVAVAGARCQRVTRALEARIARAGRVDCG